MRLFLDLALGCALCLLAWGGLRPTNASAPSRDKRQAAVYFRQSGASRFQTGQEEGEGGPRWSTPGGRSTSSSQVHDPGPPTRRARQPIRFVDDAEASAPFKFNAEDVGQLEGRSRQYESSPLRFEHGDHPRSLDYGRSDPPVTQYRHNSKDATRPESRSGSTGGFRFHDDDDDDRREPEDGSRQRALSSFRFNDEDRFSEGRPSSDSTFRFDNDAGRVEGRSNSGSFQSYGTAEHSYFSSTPDTLKFNFASSEERAPSFKVEERSKESDDEPFFRSKESSDEPFFRSKESSDEPFFRSKESSSSGFGIGFFANSSSDQSKSSGEFAGRSPKSFRDRGRQSKVSAVFDSPSAGPGFESSWEQPESPRHLSPDTLATITETLGAINTVGRYLVNYTRGGRPRPPGPGLGLGLMPDRLDPPPTRSGEDLPGAILTISKNVLGRNVTDSIAPLVRVLPIGTENSPGGGGGGRACTTPGGESGRCDDLSNCPQLLLDLANLRQSICFKSLFVPGVCCPHRQSQSQSPQSNDNTFLTESTTTYRPVILTSAIPLATHQSYYTTTPTPTPTPPPNSIDYDFDSSGGGGECGVQNVPKFRVVGGEEALPGRWPWMAAIFLHGPRRTEFWCGGSLIGAKHVLTAAHCTKDTRQRPFQARQFTVRLGDIDLRRGDEPSSPQTYRVAEVRAHARFSRVGFYNDIAVLVLDKPVRRSRYVIPVCLPTPSSRNNNFIGEQPTVVGWGTTYYGGKESTVQRQVALPVWKNEDCDRTYFQPINENFICAGLKEGGKDACQGDSGGPLILKKNGRWMQIGIVSFGNKCGEPGYPGVYTRVTQYLDWISTNTIT